MSSEPAWGMLSGINLPAGRTELVFSVKDPVTNLNVTSCRLLITIMDKENPKVFGCPSNMDYTTYRGQSSQAVYWKEPQFVDNVRISTVYKSRVIKRVLLCDS